MSFYEAIADDYDDMTGFVERQATAEGFLRRIITAYPTESALDVACGTGLYALALANVGVPIVVGTDLEPAMIGKAAQRTGGAGVRWLAADMTDLPRVLNRSFDLLLCLGNSLPHLLVPGALERTLSGFRHVLAPGGAMLLQTLNFDRILTRRERIVSIDRTGDRQFIRFYDFPETGLVGFNLLRIRWQENGTARHDLESTLLYPYRSGELARTVATCGFRKVQLFGSPALEPFDPETSPTCLLQAVRD